MRTGSPIPCGGIVARLSPSSNGAAADLKMSPPLAGVNSDRDVEAAIAITHLGDGYRRRSPMLPHVRAAVMPERYCGSRAQPAPVHAYKRKFDDDVAADAQCADPLKKAIENERNYFDHVKRGRFQSDVESGAAATLTSSKCDEKVGRFVRTCQPHRHGDTLIAQMPVLAAANFMPRTAYRATVEDSSRWQTVTRFDGSAVEKLLLDRDVPNKMYTSGRPAAINNNIPRTGELPVFRKTFFNADQMPAYRGRQTEQQAPVVPPFARALEQYKKFDVLSAFYRLGRQDVSAMTSPLRQQQQQPMSYDRRLQQQQHQQLTGYFPPQTSSSRTVSMRRNRRRNLDVETENKVKNGEFASLKSLQVFYKKLSSSRRESPVVDKTVAMRGRLGSITNWSQYHALRGLKSTAADQEMAMDLSTHGSRTRSTEAVEAQVLRLQPERIMPSLRRKSRSCCTTPFSDAAAVAFTSPQSVASPPCPKLDRMDNSISETQSEDTEELTKAESRLPLKKRRLLEVKNDDELSPVVSPLVPVKTEVFSDSDISDREDYCTNEQSSNIAKDLSLHVAVSEGDLKSVEQTIRIMTRLGMPLDCYNAQRQTPLHLAVMSNQPAIVKRLLEAGSSANVVDFNNMTSVHLASDLQSTDCLASIIQHSTVPLNFNAVNSNGLTALHLAVQRENVTAVSLLIENGARVDVTDGVNGRSPLYFAVDQNNIDIVRLLLSHSSTTTTSSTTSSRASSASPSSRTTFNMSSSPVTPWCRRSADASSRLSDVYGGVTTDVRV